jgi:hypothetical protein
MFVYCSIHIRYDLFIYILFSVILFCFSIYLYLSCIFSFIFYFPLSNCLFVLFCLCISFLSVLNRYYFICILQHTHLTLFSFIYISFCFMFSFSYNFSFRFIFSFVYIYLYIFLYFYIYSVLFCDCILFSYFVFRSLSHFAYGGVSAFKHSCSLLA